MLQEPNTIFLSIYYKNNIESYNSFALKNLCGYYTSYQKKFGYYTSYGKFYGYHCPIAIGEFLDIIVRISQKYIKSEMIQTQRLVAYTYIDNNDQDNKKAF